MNRWVLVIIFLFNGCSWMLNPDFRYPLIEKNTEYLFSGYGDSKEIEPLQKDLSYKKWEYDVVLNNSLIAHIDAGPQKGSTPQVLVKYSDEKRRREIWNYWDYSEVLRISYSDSYILYFLVSDFFPNILGESPESNMYLYGYDLKLRKPIGRLKFKQTTNADTL